MPLAILFAGVADSFFPGLDRYMAYINAAKSNPASYSAESFRKVLLDLRFGTMLVVARSRTLLTGSFAQVLSSFGPMLMYHLDAEVETLRGDNLRRYYTIEEGTSCAPPLSCKES